MKSRILVVDDQEAFARQIKRRLEKEGHRVEVSTDGKDALRVLEEERFNMVISDLKIPHMNGLELLITVRGKYPDTAFIVMTAYGTGSVLPSIIPSTRPTRARWPGGGAAESPWAINPRTLSVNVDKGLPIPNLPNAWPFSMVA